jgi:hypothetical protein
MAPVGAQALLLMDRNIKQFAGPVGIGVLTAETNDLTWLSKTEVLEIVKRSSIL